MLSPTSPRGCIQYSGARLCFSNHVPNKHTCHGPSWRRWHVRASVLGCAGLSSVETVCLCQEIFAQELVCLLSLHPASCPCLLSLHLAACLCLLSLLPTSCLCIRPPADAYRPNRNDRFSETNVADTCGGCRGCNTRCATFRRTAAGSSRCAPVPHPLSIPPPSLWPPPLCLHSLYVFTPSLSSTPLCYHPLSAFSPSLSSPPLCLHPLSVFTPSLPSPPLCLSAPTVLRSRRRAAAAPHHPPWRTAWDPGRSCGGEVATASVAAVW